jgi:hypothetical protein
MPQDESGHDGDFEGKGASLSAAIADGYEKGKASGNRTFTVHKIVVTGTNPINEYKVVLRPGG